MARDGDVVGHLSLHLLDAGSNIPPTCDTQASDTAECPGGNKADMTENHWLSHCLCSFLPRLLPCEHLGSTAGKGSHDFTKNT